MRINHLRMERSHTKKNSKGPPVNEENMDQSAGTTTIHIATGAVVREKAKRRISDMKYYADNQKVKEKTRGKRRVILASWDQYH